WDWLHGCPRLAGARWSTSRSPPWSRLSGARTRIGGVRPRPEPSLRRGTSTTDTLTGVPSSIGDGPGPRMLAVQSQPRRWCRPRPPDPARPPAPGVVRSAPWAGQGSGSWRAGPLGEGHGPGPGDVAVVQLLSAAQVVADHGQLGGAVVGDGRESLGDQWLIELSSDLLGRLGGGLHDHLSAVGGGGCAGQVALLFEAGEHSGDAAGGQPQLLAQLAGERGPLGP